MVVNMVKKIQYLFSGVLKIWEYQQEVNRNGIKTKAKTYYSDFKTLPGVREHILICVFNNKLNAKRSTMTFISQISNMLWL